VRLQVADDLLPTTWASLHEGPGSLVLRLTATSGTEAGGAPVPPVLRAVIPIPVPAGTDPRSLGGLSFGAEALGQATVGYRTGEKDRWVCTLERLSLDVLEPGILVGTMEGLAKRGPKAERSLRFEAGFVAQVPPAEAPLVSPADPP
jgi:hypothetical protein